MFDRFLKDPIQFGVLVTVLSGCIYIGSLAQRLESNIQANTTDIKDINADRLYNRTIVNQKLDKIIENYIEVNVRLGRIEGSMGIRHP